MRKGTPVWATASPSKQMTTIGVRVAGVTRRMRGGSQSLLVRDQAGNAYIAKCVGNPQGTRTLINEWIVDRLLQYLRVSTPGVHLLRIEDDVAGKELLEFQMGNRKVPIAPGIHLGSRCPVDPDRKAIFDFLPKRLLRNVINRPDFFLSFTFDRWVNQIDSRQVIFIRERCATPGATFRAYFIDHGLSFGGSRWTVSDDGMTGLFHDRSIYQDPRLETACHEAVDCIREIPEERLFSIQQEIPLEWLEAGDRDEMTRLLQLLCARRTKLHSIVDRALRQLRETGNVAPKSPEAKILLCTLLLAYQSLHRATF
jgi:hypothetical protein